MIFKSPSLAVASQPSHVYARCCTVLKKHQSNLGFLFTVSHTLNSWWKILLAKLKKFNKLKEVNKYCQSFLYIVEFKLQIRQTCFRKFALFSCLKGTLALTQHCKLLKLFSFDYRVYQSVSSNYPSFLILMFF